MDGGCSHNGFDWFVRAIEGAVSDNHRMPLYLADYRGKYDAPQIWAEFTAADGEELNILLDYKTIQKLRVQCTKSRYKMKLPQNIKDAARAMDSQGTWVVLNMMP